MQRYYVIDREMHSGEAGFEAMIAEAYARKKRVRCLCRPETELDLYIAHRHGSHVLARMPGTGVFHAPSCDHYEAPDFLTGLGEVRGQAIIEDELSGDTLLKLAFPLARGPARAAPSSFTNEKPDIKATPKKLTIRGLLHFLWDRAELTHWHPRMESKRTWYIVRRQLINASLGCKARGDGLSRYLFVPEPFKLEDRDAIARRRHSELALAESSRDAIQIIIGEIKSIESARFGEKLLVKHLPEWPFLMDDDMARRFHKRFAIEEELWRAAEGEGHLILAASFSIGASGLPQLHEMAVMPVTNEWIPFEGMEERTLVQKAVSERRRFVKGMRVNLASERPIASLTLKDMGDVAVAVHLARNLPNPSYDEALAALMRTPGIDHISWRSGDALPSPASRRASIEASGQVKTTMH